MRPWSSSDTLGAWLQHSTSQALDWFKQKGMTPVYGVLEYYKQEDEKLRAGRNADCSPLTNRSAALRAWDDQRYPFRRYY